jgi:hypothetical protein
MNSPSTISQLKRVPSIVSMSLGVKGIWSSTYSSRMNSRIAPARWA